MNSLIWEISTLIKLVAVRDITAISLTANELRKKGNTLEELDKINPEMIYECYCKYSNTSDDSGEVIL